MPTDDFNDFIYCRPDTAEEAVRAFNQLQQMHKKPQYYGGGSEIITMRRGGSIAPGAVIDLKAIPEANILEIHDDQLLLGGAVTLHRIKESQLFPLLGSAVARIADHTNQCRITLGGNICGTIIYREAVLPLLLADAEVVLYGPQGIRTLPLREAFNERLRLATGEFLYQLHIALPFTQSAYMHIKKTAQEKIDYPLVSLAALNYQNKLRLAFSGVCAFPFRSEEIEEVLNNQTVAPEVRAAEIISLLSAPALDDSEASAAYRLFVLKNTLLKVMERMPR